ncbi:MAG: polyprenyl synthetase family protein [Gammaproteobacteria bacterium]|nr:polyprenyl synthetase family protein [Gammaproteobacteria bacterium]
MSTNLAQLLTVPSLDQVRALTSDDFDLMNGLIERELRSDVPLVREIAHYIVQSGGKRLRPLIVLLSARMCGYHGSDHIKLAALVEFLHTATLLHDDVVDRSTRRRNRKSANAIWGNSASVLVGDFLYSRAFQLMIEIDSMKLMEIISRATNSIAEGEVLQLQNVGNTSLSEIEYMDIIQRKTATLFQAAAHTGAVLGGGSAEEIKLLQDFGLHFGLAFQLIDDWLDYAGTSESMGKNVGDDLAEGKATLPLIYTMTHGTKNEAETTREAINSQSPIRIKEVVSAVRNSGALDYVRGRAQQQTDRCLNCLESLAANPYRQGLEALANIALCRMS